MLYANQNNALTDLKLYDNLKDARKVAMNDKFSSKIYYMYEIDKSATQFHALDISSKQKELAKAVAVHRVEQGMDCECYGIKFRDAKFEFDTALNVSLVKRM